MDDLFTYIVDVFGRFSENLHDRVTGPMRFRMVLQPVMALVFAVRAGLRDAKSGEPPFFWAIFTTPAHRHQLLHEGWKDVGNVFVLAVLIDVAYQVTVLGWIYPGEALFVATLLAFVPYMVVRGPVTRIARRGHMPVGATKERVLRHRHRML